MDDLDIQDIEAGAKTISYSLIIIYTYLLRLILTGFDTIDRNFDRFA